MLDNLAAIITMAWRRAWNGHTREQIIRADAERVHDRASDNLDERWFDLDDQIYIGGYCLDRAEG